MPPGCKVRFQTLSQDSVFVMAVADENAPKSDLFTVLECVITILADIELTFLVEHPVKCPALGAFRILDHSFSYANKMTLFCMPATEGCGCLWINSAPWYSGGETF